MRFRIAGVRRRSGLQPGVSLRLELTEVPRREDTSLGRGLRGRCRVHPEIRREVDGKPRLAERFSAPDRLGHGHPDVFRRECGPVAESDEEDAVRALVSFRSVEEEVLLRLSTEVAGIAGPRERAA